MSRRFPSIAASVTVLTVFACGGGPERVAPEDPAATVRGFLAAVGANSLVAMGELWGSSRGPAIRWMDRELMEKRLTVVQQFLAHEEYELLPPDPARLPRRNERVVRVRLMRGGCTPVVPFTLVRYRTGWLIREIDLAAAGNPERRCRSGRQGR